MISRYKMIPGVKTIPAIWSFKRKHHPDGSVIKHKACLCAHDEMTQWEGNYWETFSPVVNWISMVLSNLGNHTQITCRMH